MQEDYFGHGSWVIAESSNYFIIGQYEDAFLYSKSDNKLLADIGCFYGDPEGGLIDWNERFCVTYGCGYIIYFLRPPFQQYSGYKGSTQWIEFGNDPENTEWIVSAKQTSDNEIELTDEDGNVKVVRIPL